MNYGERVQGELDLLHKLWAILPGQSIEDQQRCTSLFVNASEMLRQIEAIPLPPDGYMDTLKAIRQHFGFLLGEYDFKIKDERPTGCRLSSGEVYLTLECHQTPYLSCTFGRERDTDARFSIDDLLFLYGDNRYRELPESVALGTEAEVAAWFQFLAEVFGQYGHEVLSNNADISDRLKEAQMRRNEEYVAAMNEKYDNNQ